MNELDILRSICELSTRYPIKGVSLDGEALVHVEFHDRPAPPAARAAPQRQRTERDLIAEMRRAKAGLHEPEAEPDDE